MKGGWGDSRFLDLVGVDLPIVQAPMAGASGPGLAEAVVRAGGLGSLPCALLSPEEVESEAARVARHATGPINLNFFCHEVPPAPEERAWRRLLEPYYEEYGVSPPAETARLRLPFDAAMCAAVEAIRPAVVSFHFGLPGVALLDRVKKAGARILANATTVAEARWLAARGVDAVIAQGWEAGGHIGRFLPADPAAQMGLFALLPQVVDAVELPVVATGGIGDARGIAAALLLGASAVQLGTAYLHCPECEISAAHRAGLCSTDAERTVFTNLLTGGWARGLPNRLMRELGAVREEAPPYPHAASALAPLRTAAERRGEIAFSPAWAGQAARLGRALPAEELTRRLAAEARALLDADSGLHA